MIRYNIIFHLILCYLIMGLLGYQIGWSFYQYDELRLLQFPLAILSFIVVLFYSKTNFSFVNLFFFSTILSLIIVKIPCYDIFQIQDLTSLISLFFILYALIVSFQESNFFKNGIYILIFFSSIPCLFIFISIYNLIKNNTWLYWQLNSGSIRIYDSVIVSLFFLLIYSIDFKNIRSNFFYYIVVFLYTLGWLFDGARSALLSVIVALTIILIFSRLQRPLIIFTFLCMLFSFFIYKLTFLVFDYNNSSLSIGLMKSENLGIEKNPLINQHLEISRGGSSTRFEMWNFMYEKWKFNSFSGLGGGYLSKIQYSYGHHIHNLYLRLIFEWGITGFLVLLWGGYQVIILLKDKKVKLILKAGVIAVLVDAMFSGNLVYPLSQISFILLVAFVFSQINKTHNNKQNLYRLWFTKILIFAWGMLFSYLTLNYFWKDLTCWECESNMGRMAPNFWYLGGSEHLVPSNLRK